MTGFSIRENEDLASRTTLGVGGVARELAEVSSVGDAVEALEYARSSGLDTFILGGGSNTLVGDAGFGGLVICPVHGDGVVEESVDDRVRLRVGAGHDWDALVGWSVDEGWAGLECLSGIPGRVGAAPIQNIGAYGQELSETLVAVHVIDRVSGELSRIDSADCGLAYRQSHFKGQWRDRYIVWNVELELVVGGGPCVRYPELARRLGSGTRPTLREVRDAVLDLRRGKSMVYDPTDVNHRSAGSFFVNPIIDAPSLARVCAAVTALGFDVEAMPRYEIASSRMDPSQLYKLSAAWLIEHAGFPKGYGVGRAGLSSNHCLAIINRGGASASELVLLAREVQGGVASKFGVTLTPEPVFLGVDPL